MARPLHRTDRLDEAHAYRLQRLGRLLRVHLLRALQPFQLTPEQFMILFRLREQDGRPQKDLVDPAFDDRANITHLVGQLESAGLVVRERDDQDRRQRLVFLTPAGRERIRAVLDEAVALRASLFQDFDDAELDKLMTFIERVESRLTEG